MKFVKKKTFYPFPVYEFNLPAGHTCPFADKCKIKVDRYSDNFEEVVKTREIVIPKDATHIRIHGSGDFFSQWYFDLWLKITKDNPNVKFWAFTKSIQLWVNRLDEIPTNFVLQASRGSLQDELIDKYNLKFAQVFTDIKEAELSGLPIDYDDSLAMNGSQSFGLLDNFKYSKKSKNKLSVIK